MTANLAHSLDEKERTKDVLVNEIYNFDSLLLSKPISQALQEAGFYKPSPIQLKAIPLGRCGLDLIIKSKSGTGKTAVFAIIALEMIDISISTLQVVIVSSTREIAVQIKDVIDTIGKHIKDLNVATFIGGLAVKDDIIKTNKCHIAVGAPGRLKHLVEMGHLNLTSVRLFVLDEADKLIDDSFQNDINYIYYKLPENKQIITVSATYPEELYKFLERYMQSPTFVTPTNENPILLGLKQFVAIVEYKANIVQQLNVKNEQLLHILSQLPFTQCLIFSNYQQRAESISNILNEKGWKTKYISAAQSQPDRLKVMKSLKTFECRIFVSTDLMARGIDASNVDLVINYDVPNEMETYLHRMGRAGRYGSHGICITITNDDTELSHFKNILGKIGGSEFKIPKLPTEKSFLVDIWDCDVNSLEQICGVVNVNNVTSDKDFHIKEVNTDSMTGNLMRLSVGEVDQSKNLEIFQKKENWNMYKHVKDEIHAMHNMQRISNQPIITSTTANTEHFIDKDNSNVDSELRDLAVAKTVKLEDHKETSETDYKGDYLEFDSKLLLESLAAGNVPISKSKNEIEGNFEEKCTISESSQQKFIDPASLYPWIPVEESVLLKYHNKENLLEDFEASDEDSNVSDSNTEDIKVNETVRNSPKNFILSKNIALFNISKLLSSNNLNVDDDQSVDAISNYLNVLHDTKHKANKEIEEQFMETTNKNLLTNVLQNNYNGSSNKENEQADFDEDIFKIAYNFVVKNDTNWRTVLGDNYVPKHENNVEVENDDTDLFKQSYKSIRFSDNLENTSNTLACANNISETVNSNNFDSYFDYYNRMLARDAITFEDVSNFNSWFDQWQCHVESVRDYVQQNIYIQEMNNYEYYRNTSYDYYPRDNY